MTVQDLENLWVQAGGSQAVAPLMAWIAIGESGGSPTAYNGADNNGTQASTGLWQISNGTLTPPTGWSDPLTNAKYAVQKLQNQGFGAWGLPSNLSSLSLSDAFSTINQRYDGRVGTVAGTASQAVTASATNAKASAAAALAGAKGWSNQTKMLVVIPTIGLMGFMLWGGLKSA